MKLALYFLKGKSEKWADEAADELALKISRFFPMERVGIKSKALDRSDAESKKREEEKALLAKFTAADYVVLFDEKGRLPKNSNEFSAALVKAFSQQKSKIIFVIGGPYGFTENVRSRANLTLSLSTLTFNHHLAQVAALEQIYRALTIWKGIPYHNE